MSRLSDLSLVTQVTVFHNKRAFDQLVKEYQSPIRRFFLAQTGGDKQLSDDLAQETFIKAYTSIAQYRGTSAFLTWLTRIAYNVYYDYLRADKSHLAEGGDALNRVAAQASSTGGSGASDGMLRHDLYRALALLKTEERTCITLQLMDGYPIDDIASITGIPANTVKSHLKRGKEKLATYLRQNGYDR